MLVVCPVCGRRVLLDGAWVSTHREPESSATCSGSGTYVDEFREQRSVK